MTKAAAESAVATTNGTVCRPATKGGGEDGGNGGDKSANQPSSPTPSVSCETCAQLSLLEVEAFAAVREVAPFVHAVSISEILSRTAELLFLNLVTFEHENYCVELTQRGWRICSDRLDCMYGNFQKLDMHVAYYDTIYALLDNLSKQYRERFGQALSSKLSELQNNQQNTNGEYSGGQHTNMTTTTTTNKPKSSPISGDGTHSPDVCGNPSRRLEPCGQCIDTVTAVALRSPSRTPPPSR